LHTPKRYGWAAVSDDGRWLAFAPNGFGSPSAPAQFDIVSVDGGAVQTIKLAPGLASTLPFFIDSGRSLLVPNANSGSNGKPPTTPAQILAVPIGGGPSRVATTLPPKERFSGGSVSPDGKTLIYVSDASVQQQILLLDLSDLVSAGRSRKQ
jgi:Tol biopolymer transport system component